MNSTFERSYLQDIRNVLLSRRPIRDRVSEVEKIVELEMSKYRTKLQMEVNKLGEGE